MNFAGWVKRLWNGGAVIVSADHPAPAAPPAPLAEDARPQWLRSVLSHLGPKRENTGAISYRVRSLTLPRPFPGVVPENAPTMAMDADLGAVANFGTAYQWDGYGFMGYALLAELTQIPEFRRPCEILANEMTRKWGRLVTTGSDDKTEKLKVLEAEFKRFHVQALFLQAWESDNFFGRGQLYLDLGTTGNELKSPLVAEVKVKKGSLKAIRHVEPMWTYPNLYNSNNPLVANFYVPQTWFMLGTEVHTTRILTFVSRPVPDMLKPPYMFGGLSLIQLMKPYVERWLRTVNSVSDITHNFSTPVLKTDMAKTTTKGGAETLALRAQIYNTMRDNQGLLICDFAKEDFDIISAALAGLSDLQSQSQEQQASIAGIPLVKYFGITPKGLNASSDGEIRCFYDTIESLQEREGTPQIKRLLEIMQLNLGWEIDPEIDWKWEPLWSASELDQADIRKTEADTDAVLIEAGALAPEDSRKRLAADPDSPYAGLGDQAPDEIFGPEGEEGEGDNPDTDLTAGLSFGPRKDRQDRAPQDRSRQPDPLDEDANRRAPGRGAEKRAERIRGRAREDA